ncbi:MAG: hypothetical protein LBS27_00335 [Bifidobacteriaceae bacterium]|jgi:hypothetical protein|nr:hypothetical protein [Bifidobacteriaceae bacterium]
MNHAAAVPSADAVLRARPRIAAHRRARFATAADPRPSPPALAPRVPVPNDAGPTRGTGTPWADREERADA